MSAASLPFPLFAVCAPGLEGLLRAELVAAGFAVAPAAGSGAGAGVAEVGGVAFAGSALRANRVLALPTRILQRVAQFAAHDFAQLVRGAAAVDWRPYGGLTPEATCHKSRLYHSDAVVERLAGVVPPGPGKLLARLARDVCTLSVDTSGERLHRRGWRAETGAAPLRETLASALLAAADWRPGEALFDPMCGSGTLLIEAAVRASGRCAGHARGFACEAWLPPEPVPSHGAVATWIGGGDRAPAAVGAARRNAERAGVAVTVAVADAARATPPAPEGLLVCNPPYGLRVGGIDSAWRRLAELLGGPFAAWRAALVSPDARLLAALLQHSGRAAPAEALRVDNGGIPVRLVVLPPRR